MRFNSVTHKTVLIDGDPLVYKVCTYGKDADKVSHKELFRKVDDHLATIMDNTMAAKCEVYLTSATRDCFRYKVATTKPYKFNRKSERPYHFDAVRDYLMTKHKAHMVLCREADDAVLDMATSDIDNYIIAQDDKDYWVFTGELYNLRTKEIQAYEYENDFGGIELTEKRKVVGRGIVWFYVQLLTGDTSDGIQGIPGCGPVKAYKLLEEATSESEAFEIVKSTYIDAFEEDEWSDKLIEFAKLLWIHQYCDWHILERWHRLRYLTIIDMYATINI